ncbi:MAG: helicase SNF2 [Epsilonproteobacteria bacterium]|nr:MAG: helicase SNF2 [Campylobacterota bacterium]
MKITEEVIYPFFSARYFQRGRAYKKHVLDIDIEQTGKTYTLKGVVQGSQSEPYHTKITIVNGMQVFIRGKCSCPVEHNCKHVVATLLVAIENDLFTTGAKKKIFRAKIDDWFKQLSDHSSSTETKRSSNTELFFMLEIDKKVTLHLKTHRLLKNGGYGVTYNFDLNKMRNGYSTPAYITDTDAEIIGFFQILQGQDHYYYKPYVKLSGTFGVTLLEKAIKSGKSFHMDDLKQPLAMGAERAFNLQWQKNSSNLQQLLFKAEGSSAQLLKLDQFIYFDRENHLVGSAKGIDFDASMVETILNTPALNRDDALYVTKKLLMEFPQLNIPLPAQEMVHVLDTADIAFHITLQKNKHHNQLLFQVSYDANFIDISFENQRETLHERDGTFIQIVRDLQAEKEAIDILEAYGFSLVDGSQVKKLLYGMDPNLYDHQEVIQQWHLFLKEGVELLREADWIIHEADTFEMDFIEVETMQAHVEENSHWFDLSFSLNIYGKSYNSVPIIAELLKTYSRVEDLPDKLYLSVENNQFAIVPKESVIPIIETLFELFDTDTDGFTLQSYDAPLIEKFKNAGMDFSGSTALHELSKKLASFEGIEKATLPKGLNAALREYQHDGFSWLQFLREYRFGAILADDMGLGKTVQALAHLLKEREEGRFNVPTLIVAPTSLMSNWRREVEKFTPELSVLILQGSNRKQHFDKIDEYDLVLTTYPLIVRDFDVLEKHHFYYLILDEAQYIKNHRSKSAQHLRAIKSDHRLCLTGTPMENHLGELWGLFDFLMPNFLFQEKFFRDNFRTPIEQEQNNQKRTLLNDRIRPFLLRRTKNEVATELPPKTEMIRSVPLGKKQAELYESIRIAMDKQVRDAIKDKGLARSQIMILDALLKLRQVCCDPRLVKLEHAKEVKESAKFEMLFELLIELLGEGRKILLFSQFTTMLTLIEARLKKEKILYTKLTGSTRKREEAIEKFTSGEVPLFLISLKAGGVGLNLTQADTVIHYDPWWNPAAENQATDRAYRIGQDKPVFVYKLIAEHTVEERIVALQQRKQALADSVYENKDSAIGLSQNDLQDLFKPLEKNKD